MHMIVYGLNHTGAPLAVRERLAFAGDALRDVLQAASTEWSETILLSTCNRTELYVQGRATWRKIRLWLQQERGLSGDTLRACGYHYHGQAAIAHLIRVGSGLDSMALGEPQILGQLKHAFQVACTVGSVGRVFHRLFPAVFASVKTIRAKTALGAHPISMAYATVRLAERVFGDLSASNVLLVGTGETVALLGLHLKAAGVNHLTVAGRELARATRVAAAWGGDAIRLRDIATDLQHADLVITAAHSPLPLIGKGLVERALRARKQRPILMVDLGVPRNIEPEMSELSNVYLYNVDHLEALLKEGRAQRAASAAWAESLVVAEARHCYEQLQVLQVSETIRRFRATFEAARMLEIARAKRVLRTSDDPLRVLEYVTRRLMHKFLHAPTVALRSAQIKKEEQTLATLLSMWPLLKEEEKLC